MTLTADRSRLLTRYAIQQGLLYREPCEICGKEPSDAHHEDYQRPLEVRWVCRMHHRWIHQYGRTVDGMIDERCVRIFEEDAA